MLIMPRSKSHTQNELVFAAMMQFWRYGYEATSLGDLVNATKVSRHGIYSEFSGKQELFLACLESYKNIVVSPAFAQVEADGAGLKDICNYFEFQISRAEEDGLPGPGCLFANSMTELGPHKSDIQEIINAHNIRLYNGFLNATTHSAKSFHHKTPVIIARELSGILVPFTNGLWSFSRIISEAEELRNIVRNMMNLLEMRIRT